MLKDATKHNNVRLPFSWLGGALCLDFTNTVSWQPEGLSQDRITSYKDLLDWAQQAGILQARKPLEALATAQPQHAVHVLQQAWNLREHLHALLMPGSVNDQQLVVFNRMLADALLHLQIANNPTGVCLWHWQPEALEQPLWPVIWSAAHLMVGDEPIKCCGNPKCGWLFIDRSRRQNRRWCEMRECGSRAKARRYYQRKKKTYEDV